MQKYIKLIKSGEFYLKLQSNSSRQFLSSQSIVEEISLLLSKLLALASAVS